MRRRARASVLAPPSSAASRSLTSCMDGLGWIAGGWKADKDIVSSSERLLLLDGGEKQIKIILQYDKVVLVWEHTS